MTATDHLGSLPFSGDAASFPSHAELIRTLLGAGGYATLTTNTPGGHPYGSLVAYSVLDDGSPLVCISEFAEHTKNARRSSQGGLFVSSPVPDDGDPMDAPRVSIIGTLELHALADDAAARHLAIHPSATEYAEWNDFNWWHLAIESARYVGGFGTMSWVDGEAIATAQPDPVIPHAQPAVAHMNADHADANLLIARHLGGAVDATSARVRDIDRRGMTLYTDGPAGMSVVRVAFAGGALETADDVRSAVVALTQSARDLAAAS